VIVASKSGNRSVVGRTANANGLAQILATHGIDSRSSGSGFSEQRVVGLPAANLALRIAATAIAELELGVFRGRDTERRRVRTTWQARFFEGMPNGYESWSLLLEQTEASITGRNNAFWRLDLDRSSNRPLAAHFVHEEAIDGRWSPTEDRPEYRYKMNNREWSEWTSLGIVHFRVGYPSPGCVIAPSPIELARDTLAAMVAKPPHAKATFEKGGGRQIAVVYPKDVGPEQAERYRAILEPRLGGGSVSKGGVRVFGGGPEISTIGLSMDDAQFVESMQLDAEQIGQLFGVPASLLGAGNANSKPITPEHEETRWDRYYFGPRRTRIEGAIVAHPAFFGLGSRDYPSFVTGPVRGDVRTQALSLVSLVQAGILLPDDARAELGYTELADGVGQIPQVTPVGGAPNPLLLEPVSPSEEGT
jgi:HK97 family phage portal protein